MTISSISDLQMSLIGRRQNAKLRAELVRLTEEISTGQVSDVQKAISGDNGPLASVERNLSLLDGYDFASTRANTKLTYAAAAMEKIQGNVTGLGAELISARKSGDVLLQPVLASAQDNFRSSVSALQVQVGNQFVFSGLNSEQSPLIDADDMLDQVRLAVSGVTDPADFLDTIDRWFNETGNGFETIAYQGGAQSTVGLSVSSTDVIDDMFTADSDVFRTTLRDLAVISLVADGSYGGSPDEVDDVIDSVGSSLMSVDDQLTYSRAAIGKEQQSVAEALVQNQSERYALNQARNEIVGVDVFESAGRLEEVQTQLESLYLITARTSRLNLTEFLR